MKNFLILVFSFVLFSVTAQPPMDSMPFHRPRFVSNASLEFQTRSGEDVNNILRANNFPAIDNSSVRFSWAGRMQHKNTGFVTSTGFEFMRYNSARFNSVGNQTSLSDVGFNFMLGYNFLFKKESVILYPYFRSAFVYRDLVLLNNKSGNYPTLNNFLNGSITSTSLSGISSNLDLGVTFEGNFYKTKRYQNLIGISAGYRFSPIQGFGDNQIFRITDASGRNISSDLGGFYVGLNLSSYRLKQRMVR